MNESESEVLHLRIPCDRDAPRVVRHALGEVEELDAVREDLTLVASELVTNAVKYSGCGREDRLDVRASVSDDRVLFSVSDPGASDEVVRVRGGDGLRVDGFGLRLVQRLTRRWGWEQPNGHRVWAEFVREG